MINKKTMKRIKKLSNHLSNYILQEENEIDKDYNKISEYTVDIAKFIDWIEKENEKTDNRTKWFNRRILKECLIELREESFSKLFPELQKINF